MGLYGGNGADSNEEDDTEKKYERDAEAVLAIDFRDQVRGSDVDGCTGGEREPAKYPVGQQIDDEDASDG